jgi:ketosteroid isomerase-like protein
MAGTSGASPIHPIAAAETEIARAHLSLDVAVLDRLYHPNFVIFQPDGAVETKAQVLASFASGERAWSFAAVEGVEVTAAESTAVARGVWRAVGVNRGQAFGYAARFLSIWTRDGDGWRNLAYQAVELAPGA